MKLSELKDTLEQRENYFKNLQSLEKLLETDTVLAKKIQDSEDFNMPVHDILSYARMAYYDSKIAPIKKAIHTAECTTDVELDSDVYYMGR